MSRVKFFEQHKSGMCGPAALRTLLSSFRRFYSEDYLARICRSSPTYGTKPLGIIRALQHLGFKTKSGEWGHKNACWKELNYWINIRKLPVLVDWFSKFDGHYSVVVKLTKKSIWLADPEIHISANRRIKIKWNDFFRAWFDFEGDYLSSETLKTLTARWWAVAYQEPLSG